MLEYMEANGHGYADDGLRHDRLSARDFGQIHVDIHVSYCYKIQNIHPAWPDIQNATTYVYGKCIDMTKAVWINSQSCSNQRKQDQPCMVSLFEQCTGSDMTIVSPLQLQAK